MTVLEHYPEAIADPRDSVVTRLSSRVPLARESRYTSEVEAVLAAPWFHERVHELARQLGRDDTSVYKEATACLREISASHARIVTESWTRFGRWLLRGYDIISDDAQ